MQGNSTSTAAESSIRSDAAWLLALHSYTEETAANPGAWRPPLDKSVDGGPKEKVAEWLLAGCPLAGAWNDEAANGAPGGHRSAAMLRRQLVAHLAIATSTVRHEGSDEAGGTSVLKVLKRVLFEPGSFKSSYMPGQPLNEKQLIMKALGGVGLRFRNFTAQI